MLRSERSWLPSASMQATSPAFAISKEDSAVAMTKIGRKKLLKQCSLAVGTLEMQLLDKNLQLRETSILWILLLAHLVTQLHSHRDIDQNTKKDKPELLSKTLILPPRGLLL